MKLTDLTQHAGEWLRGAGPLQDVVLSSRARLARNLAGMPFLWRCSPEQQRELEERLRTEILAAGVAKELLCVDLAAAGELDRQLLLERHLISREHAEASHPRSVVVSRSESLSIMINEEDHLRIQVLRGGLVLEEAVAEIRRVDDLLEERLNFAFHSEYGYLTACPTNVGTGLRVSAMLHLPALKMTGEIEKVFRAARDLHLAVRGLYGEGTEATGDFFQVSNQTTLGHGEEEIVREFRDQVLPAVIEYEQRARRSLLKKRAAALDDKIFRSMSLLQSARMMSSEESLYLLSLVRLGVNLGRIEGLALATVNELFLLTQPAHLQRLLGREMTSAQRDEARATFIRNRLGRP